jgi:general stress protein YciG
MKVATTPNTNATAPARTPAKRGFAAMSPETRQRIASAGGKAAHESGRGHQWTSETARAAGRKGGLARPSLNRSNDAGRNA